MARVVKSKTSPPGKSRGSELLEEWRGALSQEDVAVILDIDHGAVCAFETGYRRPGKERAERIAKKTHGAVPVESWLQPAKQRAA